MWKNEGYILYLNISITNLSYGKDSTKSCSVKIVLSKTIKFLMCFVNNIGVGMSKLEHISSKYSKKSLMANSDFNSYT